MGNSPSVSAKDGAPLHQPHSREHSEPIPTRHSSRRRESIHALGTGKATPAPPSASLTSATALPASATSSPSQARQVPSTSTSRSRASTVTTPRLQPQDSDKTGSETSSQQRQTSRSRSLKTPAPPSRIATSPASRPVDVPSAGSHQYSFQPSPLDPSAPASEAYHLPPANFSRPPRLPLAIEEEAHNPGSPLLSPQDVQALGDSTTEPDDVIHRRASIISSNNDDEEEPDQFHGYMADTGSVGVQKVPTIIEWREARPSDRVYVTGTFTDWQRKFRLLQNGPSKVKNCQSAVLQLPCGTHHLKFIVNGEMMCSDYLPTTVDYTNILVNYVEVAADLRPGGKPHTLVPAVQQAPERARPLDIRPKTDTTTRSRAPSQQHQPAQAATASPRTRATPRQSSPPPRPASSPKPKTRQPPKNYTSEIPNYLVDLDTWPPPTETHDSLPTSPSARYQRANAAQMTHPAPPSLPLFLNKSILNGTTPMKDDSSVLIMPNHTVLNHLATTNIKNGVLATSATTRYKRKFLTTIMYKPRSDDPE